MAQTWRVARSSSYRNQKPLDREALERLAIGYVGRFATTRAKLSAYLRRKLQERGWDGADAPPVAAIVERFAEAHYVDDRAFADARAASFTRRGYGPRRLAERLRADGIDEEDSAAAREFAEAGEWDAALAFARRRRIGPFSVVPVDPDRQRKALAAMLRAGHSMAIAQRILRATADDVPDGISL
uniref:regulatory protein RecX n=1 Tax=Edaphosphingomonas laterariae TaxID=861865 RepID=UPI001FE921D5|nr:RecX family transcriptional regulator [Sphingomonas laterariae]